MWKKCSLVALIACLITINANANTKPRDVFYCEVGVAAGGGFVLGDVNRCLFRYLQPTAGGFIKYKFNGHYELRLQLDAGILGIGKVNDAFRTQRFVAPQVLGEFNFFNYGAPRWEAFSSWVTPTLMVGLGGIIFGSDGLRCTLTIPMGVGVKFKLSNRVNMGANWIVTKTFSDRVDDVDNPLGLNKGVWNNRDWYSTAQIYLSINFYKKCTPCRNGVAAKKKARYDKSHR